MTDFFDLVIIGGGASGLAAALAASQQDDSLRILVLEAQEQPGRKILASGNGRCNLSHFDLSVDDYCGQDRNFVQFLLRRLSTEELLGFWERLGVLTVVDTEGRVYPLSNQAATILNALSEALSRAGVELRTESPVIRLKSEGGHWTVTLLSGHMIKGRKVVLATGGLASPQLGGSRSGYLLAAKLNLPVTAVYPSLTPLVLAESALSQQLKGTRFRGVAILKSLTAEADGEGRALKSTQGEFLITDYGLSGIAAMELADEVATRCEIPADEGPELPIKRAKLRPLAKWYPLRADEQLVLDLNLVPNLSAQEIKASLWQRLSSLPTKNKYQLLTGILPLPLAEYLGRELIAGKFGAGFNSSAGENRQVNNEPNSSSAIHNRVAETDGTANSSDEYLVAAASAVLNLWRLRISGVRGYEQAQISLGGLYTSALNPRTMEVRSRPGLYIAGEVLDVTGATGGYNLHFAFASGIIAGESAATALRK